jgi:hypothetical protein
MTLAEQTARGDDVSYDQFTADLVKECAAKDARIAALEAVIEAHNAQIMDDCICDPARPLCGQCARQHIIELPA